MPKTKTQKAEIVNKSKEALEKSNTLVLADFTGLSVNSMNTLRKSLKEIGMRFEVIKKRLLKRVFEEGGVALNPKELHGQTGVVFSSKDIVETAQAVYKFQKTNKDHFKMLAGVEVRGKTYLGNEVEQIGKLPPREILLGQLVGMIAYPLKSLMFVLNEKSKKGA